MAGELKRRKSRDLDTSQTELEQPAVNDNANTNQTATDTGDTDDTDTSCRSMILQPHQAIATTIHLDLK